ncbi:aldehyde dehydrogenase (NADP(+)) [Microbacterium allomyrinae]|uniref:Aldehyde dehydrogenase (NADP(+)) n=1 Tax=Microbacterium allomyrinae TaxID=2830666 RepID=A0A9X1S256_9MICO|nr:aldehyde dehydrogenase (NADP(+)) [Microbacterium allomyrinae]MCC2031634.1 aldehyde dehydrogenase (NADP(+)) [Microbacterium allomyrinae]
MSQRTAFQQHFAHSRPTSTSTAELDALAAAAATAAPVWRAADAATRASWLRAAADALDAHIDELVAIADEETRLGETRLRGEVGRTSGQLRLFAAVVEEGSYLELTIDDADPSATPPRPELRRTLTGVGPVAVFAASNFPFAFSVAGGDTASALAAGNPVIVKAHSGHPRLSERTAAIVASALVEAGAPEGSLGLVVGREAGNALVQHPTIQAAGFTGSLGGGRALFDLANGRPDPIPFYGELGSVNPVVITAAAVAARGEALAQGLVGSFTLGVGQFCTKPGVVFVPAGAGFEDLVAGFATGSAGGPLLTDRITEAFPSGIAHLEADPSVTALARGLPAADGAARPVVLTTDAAAVAARPTALLEECFGPVTLLVRYSTPAELVAALEAVPGSLTGTLHSETGDDVDAVLAVLERKVGRVLFAGWPTGVAVTWSQHHGGPWPATTSLHTSVGATAIRRFLRPVVFQDAPAHLLPAVLRDEALATLPHRRNGVLRLP